MNTTSPAAAMVGTAGHREEALLKAGALQTAILNSANFSYIATDAKGVIQIFNIGAERMPGYAAADVINKITPADISDPQEVIALAEALNHALHAENDERKRAEKTIREQAALLDKAYTAETMLQVLHGILNEPPPGSSQQDTLNLQT